MTIQAQTPDGITHEFPDGTPDSVVDAAVKNYLAPSVGSEWGSDIKGDVNDEASVLAGNDAIGSKALQTMGNVVNPVWQGAGDIIKRIPGYDTARSAMNSAGEYAGDKLLQSGAAPAFDAAGNPIRQFAQDHPELMRNIGAAGKILPLEDTIGAASDIAKSGLDAMSANAAQTATDRAAKKGGLLPSTMDIMANRGIPPQALSVMTPAQITKVKNQMYAEGIAGNIQDARATKNGIYSMADEVGNDGVFNAADTKSQLDSLHEKYSNDPAYDGTPLVRKLDSWRSMFDEDGKITPTRLNNIMDQVDDSYRENPKSPEGEVYGAIKSPLSVALDAAKQQFPNWGALIDTADDAHYNMIKATQDDSTFTGKWHPDSQKDFQTVSSKSNNPADLMGDTQRQIANIANVKDEAELQKTMAFVPKDLQGQYLADVEKNSSTPLQLKNLAKSALYMIKGNPGWSFTNFIQSLPSKVDTAGWESDAATHITDRMQVYKDTAGQAYVNHLAEKEAQVGGVAAGARSAAIAQKALPAPPATPALPAPDILKSGWGGKDTTPMTGEEMTNAQAGRENWPSLAPGDAQPPAAYGDTREPMTGTGQWSRDFMRENKGRPMSTTQGQEYTPPTETPAGKTLQRLADPNADLQTPDKNAQFNKTFPTYNRGGKIPTPAQINVINKKAKRTRNGRAA